MDVTLNVGPQGVALGDGADVNSRAGRTGDQIVSELHGRYFEQMRCGRMFSANNTAIQALSVGLATTYTGLVLYNPLSSGKVLVPNKVKFAITTLTTFAVIGLLGGWAATGGVSGFTTRLTTQSNQIGNAAVSVGVALSAATISTPTYIGMLSDANQTTAVASPTGLQDLEGVFGILPGGFIGIAANAVANGFGFMSWEEVDLPL